MSKVIQKPQKKKAPHHPEARGLVFIALSIFLFVCLASFIDGHHEQNWLGIVGYLIAYGGLYVFGFGSYLIVTYLLWIGWRLILIRNYDGVGVKTFYFSLFLLSSCLLLNLFAETKWIDIRAFHERVYSEAAVIFSPTPMRYVRYNLGGVPFYYLYRDLPGFSLQQLLSDIGVCITFSLIGLFTFILFTDLSFLKGMRAIFRIFPLAYDLAISFLRKVLRLVQTLMAKKTVRPIAVEVGLVKQMAHPKAPPPPTYQKSTLPIKRIHSEPFEDVEEEKELPRFEVTPEKRRLTKAEEPLPQELPTKALANIKIVEELSPPPEKKQKKAISFSKGQYNPPPLSFLSDVIKVDQTGHKRELKERAQILEETLASFGIEAKVGCIYSGPTITSFEVHPAIGVKVQKIKALENDIALNMQAKSIRIIAPIPGKAAVGVEVPSLCPQEVGFKEMLLNYYKSENKCHIPMLLGKTVSGEEVVCDLTKMPHCIIAGATGSGKSVCINTIIMSIVMNLGPDDVKLILVDPKKVELTPFSKLPHLIAPVTTEPADAYNALQWLVKEMQYRYELFKQLGVRNVHAFNRRKIDKEFEGTLEMEVPEKLYFVVCIIDEFADLMMTSSSDLETPIARIAQMARAVGIHLVLATQRPSREVITGLIKANFPTRISFKVSSRINSQIILDENGAEALLGNGDMLFMPPGTSQLIRCQGVFIRDEDINRVVQDLTSRYPTNYFFESFENYKEETSFDDNLDASKDPLYEKALQIVVETRTASTTFLQRKLKIGYARAASLMDELEQNGIISAQEGSRPRRILRDLDLP